MSLTREQAQELADKCLKARKYSNSQMTFPEARPPLPDWVVDTIVFASGGVVEAECYPGGQLIDDAKVVDSQ